MPTLPLFVHERLSTRAIIETLTGHRRDQNLDFLSQLFADPRHSVSDQMLRAYEYREGWVNRMVLDDSLVPAKTLVLSAEALVESGTGVPPVGPAGVPPGKHADKMSARPTGRTPVPHRSPWRSFSAPRTAR